MPDRPVAVYALVGSSAMLAGRALLRSRRTVAGSLCVAAGGAAFIASAVRTVSVLRGHGALRERIMTMIDPRDEQRVLAIGPDRTPLALATRARAPHARLTALGFVAQSDARGLPGVAAVVGDPRRLDFPDASFDAIISLCGLSALARHERDMLCREIARVLTPGGIVVLAEDRRTRRDALLLRRAGLVVERSAPLMRESFGAVRALVGMKPLGVS